MLLSPVHAAFLFLLLAGLSRDVCPAGTPISLPANLHENLASIRKYFCDGWESWSNSDDGVCAWSERAGNDVGPKHAEDECDGSDSNSNSLCDDDGQYKYCSYYDADICRYDTDADYDCMYYRTRRATVLKFCVCSGGNRYTGCNEETGGATTPVMSTLSMSTLSMSIYEVSTHDMSTPPPVTVRPAGQQINIEAAIIGSVVSTLLVVVLVVILVLCWTNKLTCARRASATADDSVQPDQANGRPLELQSPISRNNYEGDQPDTYYKSLNFAQDKGHYYHEVQDVGGVFDDGHDGHAHNIRQVTATAPPMESNSSTTEAQKDPHYFVLEQGQPQYEETASVTRERIAENEDGNQDNHEYFVLEREDTDNAPIEGASQTTSTPGNASTAAYDHIHRLEANDSSDSDYAHLNRNPGYDHIERIGRIRPQEGGMLNEKLDS